MRRLATLADEQAIADVYLANRPDLAAKAASGDFLPAEHVRRKLADANTITAYDTAGGVVSLRYYPENEAVYFELGGFASLGAIARRALWSLAASTWRTRLPASTQLIVSCAEGDQIDTFLAARVPQFRTVQNTVGTSNEIIGPQPVLYAATIGDL